MSESVPARNVDWAMARTLAHGAGRPLPFQTVTLADALGLTLAEPVHALQAIPHYASSAMDGWAVNGEPPWTLVSHAQPDEHPRGRPAPHADSGEVSPAAISPRGPRGSAASRPRAPSAAAAGAA